MAGKMAGNEINLSLLLQFFQLLFFSVLLQFSLSLKEISFG